MVIIQPLQDFQDKVKLNTLTLFLLVRLVHRIVNNSRIHRLEKSWHF